MSRLTERRGDRRTEASRYATPSVLYKTSPAQGAFVEFCREPKSLTGTRESPPPRVSRSCVRDAPPHTPAFCKKSLDFIDCKGVDFFGDDKEAARI